MPKDAVFTIKLEPELSDAFMAAAKTAHRPASQLMRELMRDYVLRQQQAQEYHEFLSRKVDAARDSVGSGLGHSNDEVEALFAARRAAAAKQE